MIRRIGIVPHSPALLGNRLFDVSASRDNVLSRFTSMRAVAESRGIYCDTIDVACDDGFDALLFHDFFRDLPYIARAVRVRPAVVLGLLAEEPPQTNPFHDPLLLPRTPIDVLFTWDARVLRRTSRAVKWMIGQEPLLLPEADWRTFRRRLDVCIIAGNKRSDAPGSLYACRIDLARRLSRNGVGVHLYGMGWEPTALDTELRSLFRGVADSKQSVLSKYRFSIAFENSVGNPGYISEKLFDSLRAGTVPIYLGAPDVGEYVPDPLFVDYRRFESDAALAHFVRSFSGSDYARFAQGLRRYMTDPRYQLFLNHNAAKSVVDAVSSTVTIRPRSRLNLTSAALRHCYRSVARVPISSVISALKRIARIWVPS